MSRKVMIVEDDEAMAVALRDGFSSEGYAVEVVSDGVSAVDAVGRAAPDVVILDVMLPKMSGLDVCRTLRRRGDTVPVIMLTARGQEIDKVVGLRAGADDYVTKPFSLMELMARVEAVMRRSYGSGNGAEVAVFGDISVNFVGSEATKGDEPLELTALEFRLLKYFYKHRGAVVTREQLLSDVWGYENVAVTRTVDMHIAKLRKKIEDSPKEPRHIVTVHRQGYKFTG